MPQAKNRNQGKAGKKANASNAARNVLNQQPERTLPIQPAPASPEKSAQVVVQDEDEEPSEVGHDFYPFLITFERIFS